MINIGICDDGKSFCTEVEKIILQYSCDRNVPVDTNVWYSGEGLKSYLEADGQIDILFLDIELLSMTGICVGEFIRNHLENISMQIIYISGKTSYALQLFKTQPLDFLVKPIAADEIYRVMDKAVQLIAKKTEKFEFQVGKDYYYLSMGDIIYFSSEKRKIRIETTRGSYEFYGRLRDVYKKLPEEFITIHQSFIVNKNHIFRYTYESVEMTNKSIMLISPVNRKKVRELLLKEE